MRRLLFVIVLSACSGGKSTDTGSGSIGETGETRPTDADRDSYDAEEDCDDADALVNPGAEERCDEIDNDCDGLVDDEDELSGDQWYVDGDGDGYGGTPSGVASCTPPEGTVAVGGDCDDDDPAYHPGAEEADCADPADYNCDGSSGFADADGDGAAACQDCDDADATISPTAVEICDGLDNDCDGLADDADTDVVSDAIWYGDGDGDGYGDPGSATAACAVPAGYVPDGSDCDDGDAEVHPDAEERCDDADNDCDGLIDDADSGVSGTSTWYRDADSDGYGSTTTGAACDQPSGYTANAEDCDDGDSNINPGETEICNGEDDDCDELFDEDDPDLEGALTAYSDADGDGYGADGGAVEVCTLSADYATRDGDCDDADADINPGKSETCNGQDDDCSGDADNGSVCPCTVDHYDDHPYMYCTSYKTWSNAASYCETYGYELVSIDDASEDEWVYESTSSSSRYSWWWIGYTDAAVEDTWVWSDGGTSTYSNWGWGEPDDSTYLGQDCAMVAPSASSSWYDTWCGYSILFVCEAE